MIDSDNQIQSYDINYYEYPLFKDWEGVKEIEITDVSQFENYFATRENTKKCLCPYINQQTIVAIVVNTMFQDSLQVTQSIPDHVLFLRVRFGKVNSI